MSSPKKKTAAPVSDRKRLNALLKAVAETPEGGQLLEIAKRNKISIVMSDEPKSVGAVGLFREDKKSIQLLRSASDDVLVSVLPHELRHMWQSRRTNLDTGGLSAADAMVQRRVVECDAFAYQIRFDILSRQDELDEIKKALADLPDRKKAASAMKEFNRVCDKVEMKAFFMDMQQDMAPYDKQTLQGLRLEMKLVKIYLQQRKLLARVPSKAKKWEGQRKENDKALKDIFNKVAKPRPLDPSLLDIAREGLDPSSPKYLRYKNVENLAAFVRRQIPAKTLKQAQDMEQKILDTITKAGAAPRP